MNVNKENKLKKTYKFYVLIIMFFLSFSSNVFAENNIGVSGQVKDEQSKKVIEFCNVRVFNMKDSLITGGVTDQKGFFIIPLLRGNYKLITEYMGYIPDTTEISVKTGTEFIGIIKLKRDANNIDEIIVEGSTKESLIDKDVYLVTSDLKTGAANTKDVLSKVSGVNYDRYNNSIKVDGDENIIILVNGLEKDQEYIKNLAPDRLKKIEVIRDPSGRYALEGYSAIINIILKENYKGTEFHFSDQLITDPDNKDSNYRIPINSFDANINYTYNKINIYSAVRYSFFNIGMLASNYKEYDNGLTIDKNSGSNLHNLLYKNTSDNLTIGADYYINPKHTVSYESNYKGYLLGEGISNETYNTLYLQDGNIIDNIEIETNNNSNNQSNYHSFFYIGKFNKKNSLNVDFTYSTYKDNYTNKYYENSVLGRTEQGTNNKTNTKFYAEFNHTLNDKSNIQVGYGNETKNLTNTLITNNIYFNEVPEGTNPDFNLTELRHKFFAYYSWNINKKLGIKLGGAAETSIPKVYGEKLTYFIYQPYADIKYKPFKILDIQLKYRSSSDYPSISEANPFTYVIDQETVSKGNPFLSPAVKHKLSIKLNILKGLASVEPYYHFSENYISQIGTLRNDGIFELTYQNAGRYEHKGIKANLTIPFGKSLFLQTNTDFYKSKIEFDNNIQKINDWRMNSQLIYVNKKYGSVSGLIFQNNLSKYITAQGYNMWNNDFWGLFVQQPFFKKKLNVMLLYMLPLELGMDYYQGSYTETANYSELKTQDMSLLKNVLLLRVSFRMNKGQSVRKTEKEVKEEKEKSTKKLF
ncbi:MAG: TonB-dependent receptor family protein [Bacteroidales bacterium]|nr:TonB-dependent receptor family protein [Bacteroidales bacterium]